MPFRFWAASPVFNTYTQDVDKIRTIFSNPALLKVFCLQCDLFSLAKVYVYDSNDKEIPDDPAIARFNNPNPLQSGSQFLWDYMFWKMVGNAYLYMESNIVERDNAPMYWLENHKIEWPLSIENEADKLILSSAKLNEILGTVITYRYNDGSVFKFPLKKIATINDLSNGVGNWFKGFSRIDALYKVISNSEISLDSKNINVRYTAKFLVAGQQDPKDVTKIPMSADEKKDIEDKINGDTWNDRTNGEKQVHAVKSMIDIKRFVDDLRVLELDKSFLADYYLIGSMYGIPRDVLEAYASSTYENQEKARAGHISYTLEPAGEALGATIGKKWGYDTAGKKICLSWDHLPFTMVFEKDRMSVKQSQISILNQLLKAGISIEEANIFLDTEFSEPIPPEPQTVTNGQGQKTYAGRGKETSNGQEKQNLNGSNHYEKTEQQ